MNAAPTPNLPARPASRSRHHQSRLALSPEGETARQAQHVTRPPGGQRQGRRGCPVRIIHPHDPFGLPTDPNSLTATPLSILPQTTAFCLARPISTSKSRTRPPFRCAPPTSTGPTLSMLPHTPRHSIRTARLKTPRRRESQHLSPTSRLAARGPHGCLCPRKSVRLAARQA